MPKAQIIEAIEYNEVWMKKYREDIKKLEKARELMQDVGVNTMYVDNAIIELTDMVNDHMDSLKKRKQQLKLIEKFEALENEQSKPTSPCLL